VRLRCRLTGAGAGSAPARRVVGQLNGDETRGKMILRDLTGAAESEHDAVPSSSTGGYRASGSSAHRRPLHSSAASQGTESNAPHGPGPTVTVAVPLMPLTVSVIVKV